MKILYPYVGNTVGGSHKSSLIFISELKSFYFLPKVVLHQKGVLAELCYKKNIDFDVLQLPFWSKKKNTFLDMIYFLWIVFKIFLYIKKEKPSIVHVNDSKMAITWSLACKLSSTPIVIHQRTKFTNSKITFYSLKWAEKIISISEFVYKSVPKEFSDKNEIVKNPFEKPLKINKKAARLKIFKKLKIENSPFVILVVGTHQEQKRQTYALEVFQKVNLINSNIHLIFIGRHEEEYTSILLNKIEKYNLKNKVTLLNFTFDLNTYYASADLLLAPSINEGHGRTIIEALIHNVPVIATKSGGHIEILKNYHQAPLVGVDNKRQMTEEIVKLINNKKRNKFLNVTNFLLKNHNVLDHTQKIIKNYRRIHGPLAIIIESMGAGGAQQVLSRLINHWCLRGDDLLLITFNKKKEYFKLSKNLKRVVLNCSIPSKNTVHKIILNLYRVFLIRRAIKENQYKKIISFITTTNILTLISSFGLNKKVIVCERNDIVQQKSLSLTNILRYILYKKSWKITTNTIKAKFILKRYLKISNIFYVPNLLRIKPKIIKKMSPSRDFFLAIGRLVPQKNFEFLIKSFSKSNMKNVDLLIIGEGKEKEKLKKLINDLNVGHKVKLLGNIKNPYPFYNKAKGLIMVSNYEGSPNVLWEALSCGLPCIISDKIYGALEIFDTKKPYIVSKHNNEKELIKNMKKVIKYNRAIKIKLKKSTIFFEKFDPIKIFNIWDRIIYSDQK